MKRRMLLSWSVRLVFGVCLTLCAFGFVAVAADDVTVAGKWEMTFEGPRGTVNQTLSIEQDGAKIKGTVKGPRGESPLEGTVEGNKIAFTVKRDTPNGQFVIEYKGSVDNDSMKGTLTGGGGRFSGEWTAKRAKE